MSARPGLNSPRFGRGDAANWHCHPDLLGQPTGPELMEYEPSPNRFEPLHRAHSIEQVVFAVQVDRPLGDDGLKAAEAAIRPLAADLPNSSPLQIMTMALAFGAGMGAFPGTPSPVSGYVFQKLLENGPIETELRIDRSSIVYRTLNYTRWDSVWERLNKYLCALVPIYAGQSTITAIGLNYVDKFIWVGPQDKCRANLLLRLNSAYVCPHVYDTDSLWHSHTGVFVSADSRTKRLLNINLDCTDETVAEGTRRIVVITTSLTDFLNQPGYESTPLTPDLAKAVVENHMNSMHTFSKGILGATLSNEMARRVALEPEHA